MTDRPLLLTFFVETRDGLDLESEGYRRMAAARLRHEDRFEVVAVGHGSTRDDVRRLLAARASTYVVFVRETHHFSATYVAALLDHLAARTVYLAEPRMFRGAIPRDVTAATPDDADHYARDTDLYGVAFHARRLAELLDAVTDVDRTGIYLAYRLYWSVTKLAPLPVGYSTASDTRAVIGSPVADDTRRLVPVLATGSRELRIQVLRYLVLFLRGCRSGGTGQVPLAHLRDVIVRFELLDLLDLSDRREPFESAWVRWLADPTASRHLYKRLTGQDAYLEFGPGAGGPDSLLLYSVEFVDGRVPIRKSYRPARERPDVDDPAVYDPYAYPVTADSTLLFFDRPGQAGDNAEYLYEYLLSNRPEFRHTYFALSRRSPDWDRLEARGFRLVPMFGPEFFRLFLESDAVVSSQIYTLERGGKTLANSRFVYLQHGVQLNDMTDWVVGKHFDVFVATGEVEADYLRKVAPVEVLNSGLPRLESLRRVTARPGRLLFMPTWRLNLHQSSGENFRRSSYFRAVDALLTDPRLLAHLEATGRELHVKLHPNIDRRASAFRFSERVVRSEQGYREALSSAELVLTDYSSVVVDAAFIGVPVAYYQWDREDFFADQPYDSRLDYEAEGLGPVFHDQGALVDHILSDAYVETPAQYAQRRERFFAGVDPDRINETIVERMLSL